MNETKVCNHCKIEKKINEYSRYKKRSGEMGYRNVCKECKNNQDRESKRKYQRKVRGIDYKPATIKSSAIKLDGEEQAEYKIDKKVTTGMTNSNMFTTEEIEVLKDMIKNYQDNKITFEKIEDIKDKKCISISKELNHKINEISKNTGLNYSQTLESIIKKGLEYT